MICRTYPVNNPCRLLNFLGLFRTVTTRCFSLFLLCLIWSSPGFAKEYLKDWQSSDAPADTSEIIKVDRYPTKGRVFEIRRTFARPKSGYRERLKTRPDGNIEYLRVVDDEGTLEIRKKKRSGKIGSRIHKFKLGECFSFAEADKNHNFAKQGLPAYFTTPPDCQVWDGREWHQTYSTLVIGWSALCRYEAKRRASVVPSSSGRIVNSYTSIHMTMEEYGETHDWSNNVSYDETLRFFRTFNIGYMGRIEILREVDDL